MANLLAKKSRGEEKEAIEGDSADPLRIADILPPAGPPHLIPSSQIRPRSNPPRLGQTQTVAPHVDIVREPHPTRRPSPPLEKSPPYSPPSPTAPAAVIEHSAAAASEKEPTDEQTVARNNPSAPSGRPGVTFAISFFD